jgi:hypothetical protein
MEYVYLIRAYQWYKIGRTNYLSDRLASLSTLPPFDLELIHAIDCDDSRKAEAELHQTFAEKRVKGEWFLLSEEDVEVIMDIDVYWRGRFGWIRTDGSCSYAAYAHGLDAATHLRTPAVNPFAAGTIAFNAWWGGYGDGVVTAPSWGEVAEAVGYKVVDRILDERGIQH